MNNRFGWGHCERCEAHFADHVLVDSAADELAYRGYIYDAAPGQVLRSLKCKEMPGYFQKRATYG